MAPKEVIDYVLANADRLRKAGVLHVKLGDAEFWLQEDTSERDAYLAQLAAPAEGLPERQSARDAIYDEDTGARGFARRPKRTSPDEQE